MKRIIALILCLFIFSLPVFAENNEDELYHEQYKNSGADNLNDSLPKETKEYFEQNNIDPEDYNWVNNITFKGVFSHILGFLMSGAKAPLKAGAGILAIILISAALSIYDIKSSAASAAVYASVAAAAALIAIPIAEVINASVGVLKGIGIFMLSFIPIFAVIVAVSGGTVTSVSMSGLLLGATEAVNYIANFVVLPLMGGYLAIGISSTISPMLKRSGIAEAVKRLAFWIMALVSTVFVGLLSIQTAVNASADTLVSKTAKFILGSSVPLAGGVLSEALGTVTASMGLLKSSVGIYGVVSCDLILLPLLAELVIWRVMIYVTSSVADLFSLPQISLLLKVIDTMLSVLVGIILLTGAVFIISLSVVVKAI